jgi:hypothetical protein
MALVTPRSVVRPDEVKMTDKRRFRDSLNRHSRESGNPAIGHHHHLAGPYLIHFAQEAAWREDHKRMATGPQVKCHANGNGNEVHAFACMPDEAERYRDQATRLRLMALILGDPELKADLRAAARMYDGLAENLEEQRRLRA